MPGTCLLYTSLYYFNFDRETIRRNFEFYEPMTVHESSLSPHIHVASIEGVSIH